MNAFVRDFLYALAMIFPPRAACAFCAHFRIRVASSGARLFTCLQNRYRDHSAVTERKICSARTVIAPQRASRIDQLTTSDGC